MATRKASTSPPSEPVTDDTVKGSMESTVAEETGEVEASNEAVSRKDIAGRLSKDGYTLMKSGTAPDGGHILVVSKDGKTETKTFDAEGNEK